MIPYDGSESVLVAFIARLRDSFEGSDITGLILFAVFYYLQREAALRKLKNDWRIILLSGLFAVMYIAARSMDDSGTLAAVTFLLRNNAVYELLPFMILLIFCIPRGTRKRIACAVCAAVLVYGAAVHGLYPALGFKKGSEREMLSIPFQQTARYVAHAGDDVTEYEREVIGSVLDYDTLAESYSYACSDPVKNGYHGDSEALKKYFPVWFRMGLKHPTIYIDALVGISCGYIAPIENGFTEPAALILTDGVTETDIPGISTRTYEVLSIPTTLIWLTAHIIPVLKLFTMPGIYTWLTLACIVMLWIKKKASAMLPLIPGVMNILVCIASPLASNIRYCLPAAAMMPVILWWTALNVSSVSKNKGDACNG